MQVESLKEIFERDLNLLRKEIASYSKEESIWEISDDIKNSGGNLCLHLCGNLQHFIGATLGQTGYVRERDKEFADRNIPKEKLLAEIDTVIAIVKNVLSNLNDDDLPKEFPIDFLGKRRSIMEMLFQLIAHFNYHLGQINYHRRMIK